jgi:hypothetical protein
LSATVIICIVLGMPYFTDAITTGTVRSGEYPFAMGVLPESDARIPIGIAFEVGITENGFAVWRLKVAGEQVPGWFIIENGLFVPVEPARGDGVQRGGRSGCERLETDEKWRENDRGNSLPFTVGTRSAARRPR